MNSIAISLLIATLITPAWFYSGIDTSNGAQACESIDTTRMNPDSVDYSHKPCKATPKEANPDSWLHTPRKLKQPRQRNRAPERERIRIEDFETCIPGLELHKKCRSNPDVRPCKDGSYPIIRHYLDSKGRLLNRVRHCPEDGPLRNDVKEDRIQGVTVEKPRISPEQFRTFPIRGSKIASDPSKFTLRNGFTHFWASDDTQNFSEEIDSFTIRIKAIPVQWNWDYGDGNTRNFNVPGESSPNHTLHDETPTSHVYKETGKFNVVVTTLYRGEFSVDGGAWQSIPGQAAVPSDPVVMDVWRTQKQLIAFD